MAVPETRRVRAPAGPLPPGTTPDGTKGTILSVALGLIAERGFHGTSIRDLAEGAGITSATLYAHYPTKDHILAELLRIGHEHHLRNLQAAVLDAGSSPVDQLAAAVRAHVRVHATFSRLAVVCNDELHALNATLASPVVALRTESELLLLTVIQRGVDNGVFHPEHVVLALAAIGGMGLRVANWFVPDGAVALEEVEETYAAFALRIVAGPSPG
jgi:AcrR family transcriptional regulator